MANTYAENLIGSVTVGAGGASSIDFTSIPGTYTDLVIRASLRETGSSAAYITLNGSSSSFTNKLLYGQGNSGVSASPSGNRLSDPNDSTTTASTFANIEVYIPNYASSNNKSFSQDGVTENNGSTAYAEMWASLWSNTAAITSISLNAGSTNFAQYSTAYLYGISNLASAAKATGGTVTTDGTYWYHTFNSTGTFTPNQNLSVDYLVVAGGGGGGAADQGAAGGGGGGAGGFRTATGYSVTASTPYTVTVGAGGAKETVSSHVYTAGTNGSNSVFATITSTGGGKGGHEGSGQASGGSGGGASGTNQTGAAGTAGQGYKGGDVGGYYSAGAGGGGSSSAGSNAGNVSGNGGPGGNGGSGTTSTYSGSSVTYAGGGGGAGANSSSAAGTGQAGGGNGGVYNNSAGNDATANSGSGGGGAYGNQNGGNGGNGGSGIVIVRYTV